MQFPLVSTALLVTCGALALGVSHVNTRYCAFGFGGFQCNEPFIGRGEWLLLATLILVPAVPISLASWMWRVVRWWRGA